MLKPCSEFSKLLEENPIGTAPIWNQCIVIELPHPWSAKIEESKYFDESIFAYINKLNLSGRSIRLQCILPDQEYSKPNMRRVMLFSKNSKSTMSTTRTEYLIPERSLKDLCVFLLTENQQEKKYSEYKQHNDSIRDILVCTHGNRDRCCGSIAAPLFKNLRNQYPNPANESKYVRFWRTSHTGGHRFAPTIIDLPQARYWAYMDETSIASILEKHEPITSLDENYRGCALLTSVEEQNVEKKLLFEMGWKWIDMKKQISTVESITKNDHQIISAFYEEPHLTSIHHVEFLVQHTKSIPTMNCMKSGNKGLNKKYQVIKNPGSS